MKHMAQYAGKHVADSTLVKHSRVYCSTNQRPDSIAESKKEKNIFVHTQTNKQTRAHTAHTHGMFMFNLNMLRFVYFYQHLMCGC